MNLKTLTILSILGFSTLLYGDSFTVAKRTPFDVPLVRLTLGEDKESRNFKTVRVEIDKNDENALITRLNDLYTKSSGSELKKVIYAEPPEVAMFASQFESEQLNRVIGSLNETLRALDQLLQKKQWDKCLYLDAYFPKFLQNFYYLHIATFNTLDALPTKARVVDTLFDISLQSPKSDRRITEWQQGDRSIRLRIASKELDFQFQKWLEQELNNKKKKKQTNSLTNAVQNVYTLFIHLYFNLKIN